MRTLIRVHIPVVFIVPLVRFRGFVRVLYVCLCLCLCLSTRLPLGLSMGASLGMSVCLSLSLCSSLFVLVLILVIDLVVLLFDQARGQRRARARTSVLGEGLVRLRPVHGQARRLVLPSDGSSGQCYGGRRGRFPHWLRQQVRNTSRLLLYIA